MLIKKSKITLSALAVASICSFSSPSYSAILLGAKAGIDYWYADAKINGSSANDASFQPSIYASLEHFIPFVPNGKVRYTNVESELANIKFGQFDLIGYYEILDNDIVSIDIGYHFQNFKGTFRGIEFNEWQPNAYGDVRVGIPTTPLFFFTTFSGGTYDGTHTVDAEAGAIFSLDLVLIDVNFKLGYRIQDYTLNYFAGLNPLDSQRFKNQGAFLGVELNF